MMLGKPDIYKEVQTDVKNFKIKVKYDRSIMT